MLCRGYEHADRLVREGEGLLNIFVCIWEKLGWYIAVSRCP